MSKAAMPAIVAWQCVRTIADALLALAAYAAPVGSATCVTDALACALGAAVELAALRIRAIPIAGAVAQARQAAPIVATPFSLAVSVVAAFAGFPAPPAETLRSPGAIAVRFALAGARGACAVVTMGLPPTFAIRGAQRAPIDAHLEFAALEAPARGIFRASAPHVLCGRNPGLHRGRSGVGERRTGHESGARAGCIAFERGR